jgi:apolipoprotein N-acyltransferase
MAKYFLIFKSQLKLFSLALISGILIGTSYVPFPAWAIAFCYIPLWWSVVSAEEQKLSLKFIFLLGWITQFVLTLIGFNWLYYTASEFGELPAVLSALTLFLFSAGMHIYIPLALVFGVWLKRRFKLPSNFLVWVICCAHVFFERAWPGIFEWNLGYTLLWMKWPVYQWADTFGFWGLSAFIFLMNAGLFFVFTEFKKNRTKAVAWLGFIIFVVVFFNATGSLRQKQWQKADAEINFAIVQASISNDAKIASEKGLNFQNFVIDKYFTTAESTLNQFVTTNSDTVIDFMIWPETAMPFPLDQNYHQRLNQQALLNRLRSWNMTLITGGYSLDSLKKDFHGNNIVRNSMFFLNSEGLISEPYFKSQLLVFGEYMPLGEYFSILYKWLPFVGTYERGRGPTVSKIETRNKKQLLIGAQICYESLDPHFSRELSLSGAQIIVNVTNDSWFGSWAEPHQHMIMTMARGVEVRRPLIRSTNTGISTAILADGTLLTQSPIDQVWGYIYKLNYLTNPAKTFYARFGAWDLGLWLMFFLILIQKGRNRGKDATS